MARSLFIYLFSRSDEIPYREAQAARNDETDNGIVPGLLPLDGVHHAADGRQVAGEPRETRVGSGQALALRPQAVFGLHRLAQDTAHTAKGAVNGVALPQQLVHLRVAPFPAFLGPRPAAPARSTLEELGALALPLEGHLGLVKLTCVVVEYLPVPLQQGRTRGTRPMRKQTTHGVVAFRKLWVEVAGRGTKTGEREAPVDKFMKRLDPFYLPPAPKKASPESRQQKRSPQIGLTAASRFSISVASDCSSEFSKSGFSAQVGEGGGVPVMR